ncbi:MAG: VWA domain-containing protein [Woeseiaceae bacterium]|nr:VWA domain-containing protein [Woeseiaceae bacterium]
MLSDLNFIRPELLWGIPVVIVTAFLLARRHLAAGSWLDVIDERLAPHVLSGTQQQSSSLPWWLLGITGSLAFVALAGPAWERVQQPVYRSDQAMVIALDLSRSMDAQDVAPSRLLRSRLKILDLLERRATGQTALVVYSANAFTVTPLTDDTDTIAALVNSLGTDIMPSRGSYPVAAIEKGQRLLEQAGVSYGEVLLITDGGTSPAAERYARQLRESGYTLSILGVGTREGAPIPRQNGGFVTDGAGNIAVPKLEEADLRKLASAGGGRYATLTADNQDLDFLLSGEVSGDVGEGAASDESLATDQWREEGPWLVLLLLPLAALAFRRGWVLLLLVFIVPVQQAEASVFEDFKGLFLNDDQKGRAALADGDPARAAELFENPDWQNVALYRKGDFEEAAARFAESGDARNLYNLGNSMAKLGEFESALDAYEQVLEMDPADEDAAYNRDLIQELLDQQQEQQEQQQSEQGEGEGEESDSENSEQSDQDGQQSDGQTDGESQDSDAQQQDPNEEDLEALQEELQRAAEEQQQSEQQLSEAELAELRRAQEQEQAMEQWLRRIPNDPGGLLRRKFRYQYQRAGQDQDGNNLWPDDEVQPW